MNETPLKPWVAATNEGTGVTAHCNCMAGLGGACFPVGAILLVVEAGALTIYTENPEILVEK